MSLFQIHSPRFSRPVLFAVALLCLLASSAYAQPSLANGLVIYKKTLSESPTYYEGALFREMIDVAAWFDFDIGGKDMLRLEKGMVCKVISFQLLDASNNHESVLSMNITTDDDIKQITQLQGSLADEVKKSPKISAIVKSMDGVLSDLIKRYKNGYYRVGGQWVQQGTYNANQASIAAAKNRITPVIRQMGVLPLNGRLDE